MMKTMELTINEALFQKVEQAAHLTGLSISDFVQRILNDYLRERSFSQAAEVLEMISLANQSNN